MPRGLPARLLLAPLPDSADCPAASVISAASAVPSTKPDASLALAKLGGGLTHPPKKWVLGKQEAALRAPSYQGPSPGGDEGRQGQLRDPASPKLESKELERQIRRGVSFEDSLLCCNFCAGPMQGKAIGNYKLSLPASVVVPGKKEASISSNKGNVLELFLP